MTKILAYLTVPAAKDAYAIYQVVPNTRIAADGTSVMRHSLLLPNSPEQRRQIEPMAHGIVTMLNFPGGIPAAVDLLRKYLDFMQPKTNGGVRHEPVELEQAAVAGSDTGER